MIFLQPKVGPREKVQNGGRRGVGLERPPAPTLLEIGWPEHGECPAPLWRPQCPFSSAGMRGRTGLKPSLLGQVSLEGKTKPRGGLSPAPPRPWPRGSRPPKGGDGTGGPVKGVDGMHGSGLLYFSFFKFNYNVFVSIILFLHVYVFVLSPLSKWLLYRDITALMGTGPYIASSFGLQRACKASGPACPITRRGWFPQSGEPRALPLQLLLGCWGPFMLQSCVFLSGGVLENSDLSAVYFIQFAEWDLGPYRFSLL